MPVFQFAMYAFLNTHPNVLFQEMLEYSFPSYHASPTPAAVKSASANDEKALDKTAAEGKLVEPKLNLANTVIKIVLDQTVGAVFNTLLFSVFIHSIQVAMERPLGTPLSTPDQSVKYLLSGHAMDFSKVDWQTVKAQSLEEFWPLVYAGWKLWPSVSMINFFFIKTINGRNLVGSLAGVGWGIYMSLVAAGSQ